MSLYEKSYLVDDHETYVDFDKQKIIQEIKERIPNPWTWYTIGETMDEVEYPGYDLVIMRNKEVNEKNIISRQFQQVELNQKSIVSVVLGIYVSDTFSMFNKFDTSSEFVTSSIEVKSASILLEILNNIDNNIGGIKDVS